MYRSFKKSGGKKPHFKKRQHPPGSQPPHGFNKPHDPNAGPPYQAEAQKEYEPLPTQILNKAAESTASQIQKWLQEGVKLHLQGKPKSELDPWQEDAVQALQEGANVIVDAPTTAGKTRVVETFFAQELDSPSFRACYTCPVKSLSNDKMREFREIFGKSRVGISTGDVKENLNAPIVIATLESYRNSLLGVEPDLNRSVVVFDEYHFLQDESRGSAWEEAIILSPPNCQLLLLSASIANPEDFASWLEKLTGRPSRLIRVEERPVPLVDIVWVDNHWLLADAIPKKWLKDNLKKLGGASLDAPSIAKRAKALEDLQLTPCILYTGKRQSCEDLAFALQKIVPPISREKRQTIEEALIRVDKELHVMSHIPVSLKKLLLDYGIAFHHSGHTPQVRMAIESLLKEGLIPYCTATMGLSLGINFSVRSAMICDSQRPSEKGLTSYGPSEVLQMRGRAGRRGKDVVGFSLWASLSYYRKFAKIKRENCSSNLRIDPTTFLGLMSRNFSMGQIEHFYQKSFMKFRYPEEEMVLMNANRLKKFLKVDKIPCQAPMHEFISHREKKPTMCITCPLRKNCHRIILDFAPNPLFSLHAHLHKIGALTYQEELSEYGKVARFFPQWGGLLIAKMVANGEMTPSTLLKNLQLMAALSLARFKTPSVPEDYQFPYHPDAIEDELMFLYPRNLFMDAYDPPWAKRPYPVLREFNPLAGFIASEWAKGSSWEELTKQVANPQFAAGDIMNSIYRAASSLQSLVQSEQGELAKTASLLRESLLREPVSLAL